MLRLNWSSELSKTQIQIGLNPVYNCCQIFMSFVNDDSMSSIRVFIYFVWQEEGEVLPQSMELDSFDEVHILEPRKRQKIFIIFYNLNLEICKINN